jgi:hypothetical protein
MMAGGGGAGIAVEDNMDTWKKRATLRRPAILMMRRDAGYFAGMTPNTVRHIGHNKSVHLLPFYSSGIVPGMDCNIRAIFGPCFSRCSFLRVSSNNSLSFVNE